MEKRKVAALAGSGAVLTAAGAAIGTGAVAGFAIGLGATLCVGALRAIRRTA